MSSGPSKISATYNSAVGTVKEAVGSVFGSNQTEAEGKAQATEGDAEYSAKQGQQKAEGAADSFVGSVKNTAGKVVGNESLQAKGEAQKAKGSAENTAGDY